MKNYPKWLLALAFLNTIPVFLSVWWTIQSAEQLGSFHWTSYLFIDQPTMDPAYRSLFYRPQRLS